MARKQKRSFNTLLKARAIENSCYVCAANRIGIDGNQVVYAGNSQIVDFKGTIVANTAEHTDNIVSATVNKDLLIAFRKNFLFGKMLTHLAFCKYKRIT